MDYKRACILNQHEDVADTFSYKSHASQYIYVRGQNDIAKYYVTELR